MRFSVFLMGDRTGSYHDMAAQVVEAEDLGFHGAWLAERHFENGDMLWPSPMVAAAYMAARTWRIRIGLAARILPFHHPLQVAADALTLDVLSGGRFDLGISRGSMDERSHAAFGVSRDDARARFDEAYEVLRLALHGKPFSFKGRVFDIEGVVPAPRPVQRPHPPLYAVANHPQSLDDAAERGLPVFAHGALDLGGIAGTVERYEARAAMAGSTASRADVLLNRFVYVGRTNEEAHRTMREPFLRFLELRAPDLRAYLARTFGEAGLSYEFLAREVCVFGDAEHCAARLAEIRRTTGIEHLLCTFNLITLDHARCVESMRRFAGEVMTRPPFSQPRAKDPRITEIVTP